MLTELQLMKIKNSVMRILHVPGNYGGGILEMAIVADYHISQKELEECCSKIAGGLKKQNETFRNVRLNLIKWVSDEKIIKELSSFSELQMQRGFTDYKSFEENREKELKTLEELLRQLKLFYARSKVIILLTDGSYEIKDEKKAWEHLNPFLRRKLLILQPENISKIQQMSYIDISWQQ